MIKFNFIANCNGQTIPLEVALQYQPGKQTQKARRKAVGELLAALEIEQATIDASGQDQVTVATGDDIWVIGESRSVQDSRGKI